MSLLGQICAYDNLELAFSRTRRGKTKSHEYRDFHLRWPDHIADLREQILSSSYEFSSYRQFIVHDPKPREISAPSFSDRVVHTAICQVIEPTIDRHLSASVYACRRRMGSRYAAIDLKRALERIGPERFVVKLDVENYFASIGHQKLLEILLKLLPDASIMELLQRLLSRFSVEKGLPIGALTSQLFANLFLKSADELILSMLEEKDYYCRYMDDFVIVCKTKDRTMTVAHACVDHVESELELSIPFHKMIPLGNAPVPFLGFVLDHDSYRILARNRRRHERQKKRMVKMRMSQQEEVRLSFDAWANLEPHLSMRQ